LALGILDAWRGAISDDLQLSSVVRHSKGSIAMPRDLLLCTPVVTRGSGDVVRQARRWYMLIRIYAPMLYGLATFSATVIAAGWVAAAVCAVIGRIDGAVTLLLGIALACLRTGARAALVARIWGKAGLADNRRAFIAGPLVTPLAAIAHAVLAWSSLKMRVTTWAGITYEVRGPQQMTVRSRALRSPPARSG